MTGRDGVLLRRTTIELGPLRITREYRWTPVHDDYPFVDPPRARRAGGWGAAGVLGMTVALGAGGWAVAATKMPPPRYSVSVAVPERVAALPVKPARRVARAVPRPAATPVEPPPPARDDAPADTGSRAAAVAAALRTGEMQQWYEAAGDVRGFVIAGPAEQDGAQRCRALSVLTRAPGGTDRVDQRHECWPAEEG